MANSSQPSSPTSRSRNSPGPISADGSKGSDVSPSQPVPPSTKDERRYSREKQLLNQSPAAAAPTPIQVTKTFRGPHVSQNARTDLDMRQQLKQVLIDREEGKVAADWRAYATTCSGSKEHISFMKALLNEAERSFYAKTGGGSIVVTKTASPRRATVTTIVKRRQFHRKLQNIMCECENSISMNDENYSECLAFIGSKHLFEHLMLPRPSDSPRAAAKSKRIVNAS